MSTAQPISKTNSRSDYSRKRYHENPEWREHVKAYNRSKYLPQTVSCKSCFKRIRLDSLNEKPDSDSFVCDKCKLPPEPKRARGRPKKIEKETPVSESPDKPSKVLMTPDALNKILEALEMLKTIVNVRPTSDKKP